MGFDVVITCGYSKLEACESNIFTIFIIPVLPKITKIRLITRLYPWESNIRKKFGKSTVSELLRSDGLRDFLYYDGPHPISLVNKINDCHSDIVRIQEVVHQVVSRYYKRHNRQYYPISSYIVGKISAPRALFM